MTIRRAILALGMVAALTFGAMALFGGQTTKTAEACCAGDPVLATENGMTIFAVGAPLAPVGGTINFRIAITTANVPYGGYTWDVLTSNVGVAAFGASHFTIGSGANIPLVGLGAGPLCAGVNTNQLGAAPFIQLYGEGAGCASSVGATTLQLGDIATFSITCDEPGQVLVAEVDPAVPSASFPQTTLDTVGNNIPTELGPQLPNPLIAGAFIGGAGGLCVQAGDLGITKVASSPTNVVGGNGTYTLSATEAATRTFSGAGTAYVTFPAAGVLQDSGKGFPVGGLVGASVTISGAGPYTGCTWTHVITSNTATQLAGGVYTIGGPAVPCAGLPDPFFAGGALNGIPYKTTAVAVGTIANVTDNAPAGVTFSGAVAGCTVAAGSVTCVNKAFAPGANAIGTFTATYNTCGNKVNTATIGQPNPQIFIDVVPGNNSSSANVNVDCSNISLTKAFSVVQPAGNCPSPGVSCFTDDLVNYTITVSNDSGGTAATNVVVTDALTAGTIQTVSSVPAGCAAMPCTIASIPSNTSVVITVVEKMPSVANPAVCDTSTALQDTIAGGNGLQSAGPVCVLVKSKFINSIPINGIAKDTGILPTVNGALDPTFQFTIGNIFLCKQNLGGLPAIGVPPAGSFSGAGQSACNQFKIAEVGQAPADADTCNDQAADPSGADVEAPANYVTHTGGGDAPCAGLPGVAPAPWQWVNIGNNPNMPPSDICLDVATDYMPGQTAVNCETGEGGINGTGETSEGLGAFEFQVKFDDKLFQSPTFDCTTTPAGQPSILGSTGRIVQPQVSIITENWVMFGCVSKNPQNPVVITPGADISAMVVLGTLTLNVQPDLFSRMRPAKDNGVSTNLLDENCEFADTLGQPLNQTLGTFGANFSPSGGVTNDCRDATLTIRMLEGDINLDCQVDISDDQGIAFRYGQFFGQLNYNRFFDLEPNIAPDFDIDIKDLQTVFGRNGSTCAKPIPDQPPMNTIPDP